MKQLTTKIILPAALPLLVLVGCGGEEVSFETQEDSRRQAIENAEYNARGWRDSNAPSFKILMRGDSTISPSCAQGDGWATVDLKKSQKIEGEDVLSEAIQLKCSTVSGTIGCLKKEDFQERSYADEDGRCNTSLSSPLPKIAK